MVKAINSNIRQISFTQEERAMPMIVTVLGNQDIFFLVYMLVYYTIVIALYNSLHSLHAYQLDTFGIKVFW